MEVDSVSDVLQRGDEAPPFELPGTNGRTYSLEDFADRAALLVVFTCNHCPFAQAKMAQLNSFTTEFPDLTVVGINPNDAEAYPADSFEQMKAAVENGTVQFDAYLHDESQSVAAAYGVRCTPDPFLFRNDGGTFRLAYHGRIDDALNPDDEPTEFEMRHYIQQVLAGEEITDEDKPSRGCSIKWRPGNEPDYWN